MNFYMHIHIALFKALYRFFDYENHKKEQSAHV